MLLIWDCTKETHIGLNEDEEVSMGGEEEGSNREEEKWGGGAE